MSFFIFSFIILLSPILSAKEISNQACLRKASYLLTGASPTLEESQAIESLSKEEFKEYFESKVDDYINRESFPKSFKPHLLNLFRMFVKKNEFGELENDFKNHNAFDNLIEDLLNTNQPWRNLLLSQDYQATDIVTFSSGGDLLFFQFVFYEELGAELQNFVETQAAQGFFSSSSDVKRISLRATTTNQKQTLAGVITTQRFFGRFPTTKINKNRARAAALFRAFLCDPMKPIVLTNAEEDNRLLAKSLQMEKAHNGAAISLDIEARHGTDPQCMACHYKLDPMARVFSGSSLNLNPFAAHGALVFESQNGEKVEKKVTGFKELAEAIVSQDDYLSCQVQHFWDWVIGEDIPLDVNVKQNLVDTFVALDEKPKDFIKYLMTSEDFYGYTTLGEEDIRYAHVRPIFQRCDSCHSGESMAPDLSGGYPFNEFYEQFYGRPLVEQIAIETKIAEHGAGAKMPPSNAGWSLRPEERDLLLAWIKNGAKDNNGQPHYNSGNLLDTLQEVEYEEGFKEVLEPTFYTTFSRLLAGNLLLEALSQKFSSGSSGLTCGFSDLDRNTVGFPTALDGKPIFKYVNPNYLRWWYTCLKSHELTILQYYTSRVNDFSPSPEELWNDISPEIRNEVFSNIERHILGLGLLSDRSRQDIFEKVNEKFESGPAKTQGEAMALIARTLLSSRYFLTY